MCSLETQKHLDTGGVMDHIVLKMFLLGFRFHILDKIILEYFYLMCNAIIFGGGC